MAEIEYGMSAAEYDDWYRYWLVEPWGALRDNMHAGLIAAQIVNTRMGRARGDKGVSTSDFMLKPASEQGHTGTGRALAFFRAIGKRREPGSRSGKGRVTDAR